MIDNSFVVAAAVTLYFILVLALVIYLFKVGIPWIQKMMSLRISTNIQGERGDVSLINRYVELTGDTRYKDLAIFHTYAKNKLLDFLEGLPGYKSLSQVCTIGRYNCEYTVEFVLDGQPAVMRFNSRSDELFDDKKRLRFVSDNMEIEELEEEEGSISVVASAELVYANSIEDDNDALLDFLYELDKNRIEKVSYPVVLNNPVRLKRLVKSLTGFSVAPFLRNVERVSEEYLDAAYMPIAIDFHGEKHKLKMSDALPWLVSALQGGQNVYMFGKTGTGKTRLSEQIQAAMLDNDPSVNCIQITASMLNDIASTEGQAAFIAAMSAEVQKGMQNILVFDEAESALEATHSGVHSQTNSIMLQLLDGPLGRDLGATCLLIFNAPMKSLNPIAFRKGRMGVAVEVTPLDTEHARSTVKVLQTSLEGKVFDQKQFENALNQANFLSDGSMYAGIGEMTIADVYDCFMDRDSRAMLLDALRRASGISIPKGKKKPKGVSIPEPGAPKPKVTLKEPGESTPTVQQYKKKKDRRRNR